MLAAAWHYGHGKLILMDGTFGVCLQKILLFVVLVIDENYERVPVALFMFLAPTSNQQMSAGYDATILERFLSKRKVPLGTKDNVDSAPKVRRPELRCRSTIL
ncbi:hypothetical protein BDK51DRAFT_32840 [Blyttiomyces helicus]|uniref:MULE transposase domain-containing protein n=1 Tax=Blyttiomyces helicus TaxID=388810 RepID=A0A4P9VYD2_9FUNG|nr:hypothetical protein BDK51DRAFT_32840 [Blyttiomyces helicus]|eukprot:RKO82786.1 hypothetical protein BDK51DRAFT_32840 [Blyttiomyces helicus]